MINSKNISKITIVLTILALIICIGIVYVANGSTDIKTSDYEEKIFGNDILSIDIEVDESEWQSLLDNAMAKEYISGDLIINGTRFSTVGIRTKGNSSLSQVARMEDSDRYSLQFKSNKFVKGQTFYGLDSFCINNIVGDTTYMKDYIAYDLMNYIGVDTPLTNYANVTVNGEDFGFYIALERYDKSFLERVYNTSGGELYNVKIAMGQRDDFMQKVNMGNSGVNNDRREQFNQRNMEGERNPFNQKRNNGEIPQRNDRERPQGNIRDENFMGEFPPIEMEDGGFPGFGDFAEGRGGMGGIGGRGGGSLIYTDDNISSYSAIFNNPIFNKNSDKDKERVITAIKNLNEGNDLENYIEVDKTLRYLAAHTVVVNLDSYSSNMAQNYYLYERDGKLTILPWDYNFSFGGFQSGNSIDVINFPIDTPVSGVSMEDRPLINKLLEIDEYRERYHNYLQEIVDEYFFSGVFEETIISLDEKINEYVKNDTTSFTTYEKYEASLPVLIELGNLRAESINGQLNGTIPSTTEEQRINRDLLVDASHINLSDLGSMMGGGGFGGRAGDIGDRQDFIPDLMDGNVLDMNLMQETMTIFRDNGNVLTDEAKELLVNIGLTEEQMEQLIDMQSQMRGGRNENFLGNRGNFSGNRESITRLNKEYIGITILSLLLLGGAFIFIYKARKNY